MGALTQWDSETIGSPSRLAAYCDFVAREYEPWRIERTLDGTLRAWVSQRRFGEIVFLDVVSSVVGSRRTPVEIGRSKQWWVGVIHQRSGQQSIRTEVADLSISPGDICLYCSKVPCEITRDSPTEFSALMIPFRRLEESVPNLPAVLGRKLAREERPWRFLRALFAETFEDLSALTESEGTCLAETFIALLGAAAMSLPTAGVVSRYRGQVLSRLQSYIDEHLQDTDLSTATVAEANGLSARNVQRLFADVGWTVSGWIRVRRLERCRSDLGREHTRGMSVTDIAFRWGFADASHFSRTFKGHYGVSPLEYRRLLLDMAVSDRKGDKASR